MGEPDDQTGTPTPLGLYDQPPAVGLSLIEIAGAVLAALWFTGAAIFVLTHTPETEMTGGLWPILALMVVVLPPGMIWIAVTTTRASRILRRENLRLQSSVDALRQAFTAQAQNRNTEGVPSVARKLDEIAAATRKTETALASFTSTRKDQPKGRATVQPKPEHQEQPSLALGPEVEDPAPLVAADFITALNFPETAEDEQGFAALRRALKDRRAAQLIQASQDVLTLLSQEGIYMDDLIPDRARPEIWRQFAQGTRGREIAALGGVRDRSSLALTAARLKQDTIFRDAAHHFLRLFDKTFASFEPEASDAEISALTNTRTARAFMLLGRAAGTFD